jgi:hypothetical protein
MPVRAPQISSVYQLNYAEATSKCGCVRPETARRLTVSGREADVRFIPYIIAEEPADTLVLIGAAMRGAVVKGLIAITK